MWTDASGIGGIGGFWLASLSDPPLDAFSERFNTKQRSRDIQVKEMRAVLFGMRLWPDRLRGAHLTIHCDNQAVCCGLTSGSM